ncbi:hypothetical protein Q4602_02085 [Paraglaciecola chathamensis]|uniref:hypothetical protein n=1 Tax=Paraglaciecola chathamensis TaxID=368405 RepID=UPI0026F726B2|nr:hypothetical protein [Paraglaciecola chathamensis]MDO6838246.1 hypothetical protein [Paraglaciecola chathamensis]
MTPLANPTFISTKELINIMMLGRSFDNFVEGLLPKAKAYLIQIELLEENDDVIDEVLNHLISLVPHYFASQVNMNKTSKKEKKDAWKVQEQANRVAHTLLMVETIGLWRDAKYSKDFDVAENLVMQCISHALAASGMDQEQSESDKMRDLAQGEYKQAFEVTKKLTPSLFEKIDTDGFNPSIPEVAQHIHQVLRKEYDDYVVTSTIEPWVRALKPQNHNPRKGRRPNEHYLFSKEKKVLKPLIARFH